MDSPSSSPKPLGKPNIQRFIRRVISPAIVDKTCPICLRTIDVPGAAVLTVCFHAYCLDCIHKWSDLKRNCPLCNSTFDSWFYKIDLSSLRYLKQQLPAISDCKSVIPRPRSTVADRRRIIERTRREMNDVNRRTRPLPWRRSFGRPGTMLPHVIAERKLQWRASVYNRRLQAVPIYHGNGFQQNVPRIRNDFEKEKLLRRIEPWIQRELEAILGDPDPSIILHVVSSLRFSRHEGKHDGSSASSTQLSFVNDNFLAPLEPFLHDRTNMFWHELRSVPSELVILDGLVMAALSVVKPSVLSNCLKLRDPRSRGCGSRRISRAEQIKHVSRSCKQARCQPTNSCNSRQISRAD